MARQIKDPVIDNLRQLVKGGKLPEAHRLFFDSYQNGRRHDELLLTYADILGGSGLLEEAGQLLREALRGNPDSYPLLLRLGRIDEKRGRNLSAFDLYQRAQFLTRTTKEKNEIRARLVAVKQHIRSRFVYKKGAFALTVEGEDRPLELEYDLALLAARRRLLQAIVANIDHRARDILEVECGTGLITRCLADYGFRTEGVSSAMDHIVLSLGFEYAEALRMAGSPAPSYYRADLAPDRVGEVDKKDVIAVLPAGLQWYADRGPGEAAALLAGLAERAGRQLFFYFAPQQPASPYRGLPDAVLKSLTARQELYAAPVLCLSGEGGERLYRIDRGHVAPGGADRVVARGLDILSLGRRASVFDVDVARCRSLNGFCPAAGGWDHFAATLRALEGKDQAVYEESVLKRFYELYRPRNRGEQFFGTEHEPLPPLYAGWTLLPWMESKDRVLNPAKSPQTRPGGNHHYGPASAEFGQREFKKLLMNYALISREGYKPEIYPDGYVQGNLLKNGDDYRFLVSEGQHRMGVIGTMGYKTIRVKFNPDQHPVTDIKRIKQWPQVKSGLYSEKVAEKVFRYYFEEDGRRKAKALGLLD